VKRFPILAAALPCLIGGIFIIARLSGDDTSAENSPLKAGETVTTYRKVPVYSNGDDYTKSHGKHHSTGGYYYGQKWQCVEFVKRFYHDAFDHKMPSVWGHAKNFYDPAIPHGSINKLRGMTQFKNGGRESPRPDDLLVFNFAPFGHVSVISAVRDDEIEVIQQNIAGKPRQTYKLEKKDDTFTVKARKTPVGWLRLPAATLKKPAVAVEAASSD